MGNSMNKVVSKLNGSHYIWGNGCDSWVLCGLPGLSVKQEKMPVGAREQLHYHKEATQFFFMLKGVANFYLENEMIILKEQEGLIIEKESKHFVKNESNEPIEFLVIS